MKETIIKVEGMACSGCENRIQNALKNIEGVKDVVANYKTGLVTITLNSELEISILEEKIENIGFNVVKEN